MAFARPRFATCMPSALRAARSASTRSFVIELTPRAWRRCKYRGEQTGPPAGGGIGAGSASDVGATELSMQAATHWLRESNRTYLLVYVSVVCL